MSVILKKLSFSNMFSYGKDNTIILNDNPITQLVAPNGVGKSSIAIIIQELLYNKNIKGIKKSDIVNRYLPTKKWDATLEFDVEDDNYKVFVSRNGATGEISLVKNNKNISEHKTLDTYKIISEAIGRDFETFSQLTYQSSTDSLEFLKATDSNRKKFLVNLFNMDRYLEIGEELKAINSAKEKELAKKQGELKTVVDFLNTNELPKKAVQMPLPEVDHSIKQEIEVLQESLSKQQAICKAIDKNNLYIKELNSLFFDISLEKPESLNEEIYDSINKLKNNITSLEYTLKKAKSDLKALDLTDICYACKQPIDNSKSKELSLELQTTISSTEKILATERQELLNLTELVNNYDKELKAYNNNNTIIEKFTQISQLIDNRLPSEYPDYKSIQNKIVELTEKYKSQIKAFEDIQKYNESVIIRNAKIDGLVDQIRNFKARQELLFNDILNIQDEINSITILRKAFSPSGIVAYKLENVTKQLEDSINHYLSILSDGQFQIIFRLNGEKLNIVVINNGIEVTVESLSAGEFSRVQTSVLLAVRGTLAKIGGKNINLLFLDEIMGVLDDAGKERLFEVLQEEKDLNVFLISHEYSHPLIPKIEIKKDNNISSISS